jgi:predicted signal transduction protein with EAL and GGDEF domain
MANALYDFGREGFLASDIDWDADSIKVALVDATYVRNLATHDFHDDLTGIVATSGNLASKTVAAGVADAADVTLSAVSGATITQLVIYQDTGVSATSRLIANIDTATGLPLVPNGGDITVSFDNGVNKIFKL